MLRTRAITSWFARGKTPPGRPARRRPLVLAPEALEPRAVMAIAVASPLPDLVLAPAAAPVSVATDAAFAVSGVSVAGTVVRFAMQAGDDGPIRPVFIELYDKEVRGTGGALVRSAAPISTANFLSYVDAGSYDSTFIHRATDFAGDAPGSSAKFLQGGGFANTAAGVGSVATGAPIALEWAADRPNAAGTIAYARTSDVNSATSGFFFNVSANPMFDAAGNRYAVFGRVAGDGLATLSSLAALPRVNAGSPFDTLPVSDLDGLSNANVLARLVMLREASVVAAPQTAFGVAATSSAPGIASVKVDAEGRLSIAAGATRGTATITVTATDLAGQSVSDTFDVVVGVPGIAVAAAGTAVQSGQSTPVSLGSARQGTTAQTVSFTVSNPGDAPLALGAAQVPAGVTIVSPLPTTIPAGGSATLVVGLDTAAIRTVAGSIVVPSSAAAGAFSIPVSGGVFGRPAAPTGVSTFWATATRVTVTWTAADPNGSPLTSSVIYALRVGTTQWVKMLDVPSGSAVTVDVPSVDARGNTLLDVSAAWAFKVASRNAAGWGPMSSGTKYLMAPIAPAEIVAAAVGPGTALVTWTHAVQPWDTITRSYRPLTGYVLFYRELGVTTWTRVGEIGVVESSTVTGLTAGKTYLFAVRAKSDSGGSLLSKQSNRLVIT